MTRGNIRTISVRRHGIDYSDQQSLCRRILSHSVFLSRALQLSLQLPVSRILKRRLDSLARVTRQFAFMRTVRLEASLKQRPGLLIGWRSLQHRFKIRRRQRELSLFPQGVTDIEPVVGIRLVARQGFVE